jgi:hypothetical protein
MKRAILLLVVVLLAGGCVSPAPCAQNWTPLIATEAALVTLPVSASPAPDDTAIGRALFQMPKVPLARQALPQAACSGGRCLVPPPAPAAPAFLTPASPLSSPACNSGGICRPRGLFWRFRR